MTPTARTVTDANVCFARTLTRRSPALAIPLLGALLAATSASAEEARPMATVSPILQDGLPDRDRTLLAQGFDKARRKSHVIEAGSADDCFTEACWQQLAQTQHAEFVSFFCAAVEPQTGLCDPRRHVRAVASSDPTMATVPRSYRFAVVVYSVLRKTVTTASANCSGCSGGEAADRLQGLAETLFQGANQADAVGSITLRDVPAESLVFVDGVLRAQTNDKPLTLAISANENHSLMIHPARLQSHRVAAVRVQPGETLGIEIPPLAARVDRDTDDADSPPAPVSGYVYPTSPPAWRWALPLVLIGAGGLLLGLGGRAFALRGTCTDQAGCPMTYNTEQVGMGLLGAGGALVGIGGITLALGVQKVYVRVPPSSSD